MFDPLAEVFDHVLVLHPFDINILWRWIPERISAETQLQTESKVNKVTHVRTDAIGAIRYLWKGIIQRRNIRDD